MSELQIYRSHQGITVPSQGLSSRRIQCESGRILDVLYRDDSPGVTALDTPARLLICVGYVTEIGGTEPVDNNAALHIINDAFGAASTDADIEVELLHKIGDQLNGSYAIVVLEKSSGRILALQDPKATRPLWHVSSGNTFALSTTALPLMRVAGPRLDSTGLLSFLLYGAQLDPSLTILSDIKKLEADSVVAFTEGRAAISSAARPLGAPHPIGEPEALDSALTCLRAQARRIHKSVGDCMLFLSGGLDSRIMAGLLVEAGMTPLCVTLLDRLNPESRTASKVAKALQLDHRFYFRDDKYYLRAIETSLNAYVARAEWAHSHFSQAIASITKETGHRAVVLGGFIEAMSKVFAAPPSRTVSYANRPQNLLEFIRLLPDAYRPANPKFIIDLLQPAIRTEAETSLFDRVTDRIHRYSGQEPFGPLTVDRVIRLGDFSAFPAFPMFEDVRVASLDVTPCFDRRYYDLIRGLSYDLREGRRLAKGLLSRLNPRLASIADSNSLLPAHYPDFAHRAARRIKPILGFIRRRAIKAKHTTTGSWPHLPALMTSREEWKREIQLSFDVVKQAAPTSVRGEALDETLRDFFAGDQSKYVIVRRVIALAHMFQGLETNRPGLWQARQ